MKRILMALVLGLACFACGNNDCEDAADKMKECLGAEDSSGSGSSSCQFAPSCRHPFAG